MTKKIISKKLIYVFTVLALASGCANTGKYQELVLNGKSVVQYRFVGCKPAVKFDGFELSFEDIEYPIDQDPLKFKIGKIGYKQTARRKLDRLVLRFDGAMQSACQTLVLLRSEDKILQYSQYRDAVFSDMIKFMSMLDATNKEEDAEEIVQKADSAANDLEDQKPPA